MMSAEESPQGVEGRRCAARGFDFARQLLHWGVRQAEQLYPLRSARPIHTVGILGAGVTGSRISLLIRQTGWNLVVVDSRGEALDRVASQLEKTQLTSGSPATPLPSLFSFQNHHADISAVLPRSSPVGGASPRLILSQQVTALADCDLVLECISENVILKQTVLREVEAHLGGKAVLGTNTSTIPISRLAEALKDPGRFCGIHFFMPIPLRPVVEIVRSSAVRPQTIATAVGFVRRLGFTPLVVEDGPGFLVNRLLFAWLNEALQLLADGVRPAEIDRQARQFGWALGPFALMDWIGLDVVLAGAWQLAGVFEARLVRSSVLVQMVKKGYLGRKTGVGFYRYDVKSAENPKLTSEDLRLNPDVASFLPEAYRKSFLLPLASTVCLPQAGPKEMTQEHVLSEEASEGGVGKERSPWPSAEGNSGRSGCRWDSLPCSSDGILESLTEGNSFGQASCMNPLHLAMLVEVEQIIAEGRLQDPRQVDLAVVWGLGFPPQRGGLLAWSDQIGLDRLLQGSEPWTTTTFRRHSAYQRLWERAHTQRTFYPNPPEPLEK